MNLRPQLIKGLTDGLEKNTREIRFICASTLQVKRIPALEFRLDERIESEHKVAPYLEATKKKGTSI